MDTFMDQLAEKKNAQEMIRANTTAELADFEQLRGLDEKLAGMNEAIKDGYHKECVKVYRNVQAAFTEENEKQTAQLKEALARQEKKLTLAVALSGLAFVAAAVCLALQIMIMVR
ncbi:MAG: hypothetical protein J6Z22_05430 [Lachnospiraceae bacterium]|nr:hypothetical protein [Lachnospiraceae bacterium]